MRRGVLALLVVALASGAVAGTVANAKGRLGADRARIPALPAQREIAHACPVPAAFRPAFTRAANDTGLPLAMLVAVGQIESNLTPDARSKADARGLLQVLPATGAALQLDVDRPASNVLAARATWSSSSTSSIPQTSPWPPTTPARPPSPAREELRRRKRWTMSPT